MDIWPAYSYLLGRLWIHVAGAVPFSLHQKVKFITDQQLISVMGEKELMINTPLPTEYSEGDEEALETSFQALEIVGITSTESRVGSLKPSKPAIMAGPSWSGVEGWQRFGELETGYYYSLVNYMGASRRRGHVLETIVQAPAKLEEPRNLRWRIKQDPKTVWPRRPKQARKSQISSPGRDHRPNTFGERGPRRPTKESPSPHGERKPKVKAQPNRHAPRLKR
ncbi:hypothetical protein CR513_18880, partial [Mucuna pruriens]